LVGDGDLGEADLPGQFGNLLFVGGVAVAVHEDDRAGADAVVVGLLKLLD